MTDIRKVVPDSITEPTKRLLELVGLAHDEPEPLTAFAGVPGEPDYGLVVVGRMAGGRTDPFTPEEVRDPNRIKRIVGDLKRGNRKPEDLATPFWSHAKAATEALDVEGATEDGWVDQIGWTTLYRIVPQAGELSPGLRTLQQGLCAQLLWREILLWRPRRVLFMTGLAWAAPFVFAHHSSELAHPPSGEFVRGVGALRLQNAKTPLIVVTDPPDAAAGDADVHGAEIAAAFRRLGP